MMSNKRTGGSSPRLGLEDGSFHLQKVALIQKFADGADRPATDLEDLLHIRIGDEVVLKKSPRNLGRVFELLTELSDDFMENGREQTPLQERELF